MTEQQTSYRGAPTERPVSPWTVGLAVFAGIVMMMAGVFGALEGFVAIVKNEFYVVTPHYVFEYGTVTWGWVHLLLGILVASAGYAVLAGRLWGRIVGIAMAVLSAVVNFLYVPYYPLWSMLIIALDVLVIWALSCYDPKAADPNRY